jgi:hypothetical protein
MRSATTPLRAIAAAIGVAALVASATACSGDSDDEAPSSTVRATTTAAAETTTSESSTESSVTTRTSAAAGEATFPTGDLCRFLTPDDLDAVADGFSTTPGDAADGRPDDFNGTPGCDYGVVDLFFFTSVTGFENYSKEAIPTSGGKYLSRLHTLFVDADPYYFRLRCVLCDSDTEEQTLNTLAADVTARLP